MLKNPKLWGTLITVALTIIALLTGMDIKKVVCEPAGIESAPASK
jgi:hypothetical protein